MMTKMLKWAAGLLALTLCLGITARADGGVRADIPVTVTLSGDVSQAEVYTVELTANDAASPMPDGAVEGVYALTLKAEETGHILVDFQKPGVYTYTVRQRCGNRPECCYDDRVYCVTVWVTNDDDGGLAAGVTACIDQQTEKQSAVAFDNAYEVIETQAPAAAEITTPKTGDSSHNILWATLMTLSLAGAVVMLCRGKREMQ